MNLTELALKHGSDKAGHHNYTPYYERYFEPVREQTITLLELGIGGYEYKNRGGASLKMWWEYFPNAKIVGVDLHEKVDMDNNRTVIYQASQDDEDMLSSIVRREGRPHIIIDDASHVNQLTVASFNILWKDLLPGGVYVVEDIETSWGGEWCNGCTDPRDMEAHTTINFFRRLLSEINWQYIPHYTPVFTDIEFIHFYKNIIFVGKKIT